MGNFWTVLFVHLAKYESISMVPKVYSIHFCTTVCQFEKPEKRHFFYPVLLHYVLRATLLFQLGECTTFLSRDKTHTKYNKPASYSYLPQEKKTGSRAYFLTF